MKVSYIKRSIALIVLFLLILLLHLIGVEELIQLSISNLFGDNMSLRVCWPSSSSSSSSSSDSSTCFPNGNFSNSLNKISFTSLYTGILKSLYVRIDSNNLFNSEHRYVSHSVSNLLIHEHLINLELKMSGIVYNGNFYHQYINVNTSYGIFNTHIISSHKHNHHDIVLSADSELSMAENSTSSNAFNSSVNSYDSHIYKDDKNDSHNSINSTIISQDKSSPRLTRRDPNIIPTIKKKKPKVLILLHGYGAASTFTWRNTLNAFLPYYDVIHAIDLPGFGRSLTPPGDVTMYDMTTGYEDVLDRYCAWFEQVYVELNLTTSANSNSNDDSDDVRNKNDVSNSSSNTIDNGHNNSNTANNYTNNNNQHHQNYYIHVVAHSFGGYLMTHCLSRSPQPTALATRLLLADVPGFFSMNGQHDFFWINFFKLGLPQSLLRFLGQNYGRFFVLTVIKLFSIELDSLFLEYWFSLHMNPELRSHEICTKFLTFSNFKSYGEGLALVSLLNITSSISIAFVYGEKDTVSPIHQGMFLHELGGYPVTVIPNIGHAPYFERTSGVFVDTVIQHMMQDDDNDDDDDDEKKKIAKKDDGMDCNRDNNNKNNDCNNNNGDCHANGSDNNNNDDDCDDSDDSPPTMMSRNALLSTCLHHRLSEWNHEQYATTLLASTNKTIEAMYNTIRRIAKECLDNNHHHINRRNTNSNNNSDKSNISNTNSNNNNNSSINSNNNTADNSNNIKYY